MSRAIRVMVVDDSAVMRQVMTAILSREPDMEVVIAQEPFIAMRKMKEALPDVILLDLEMPKMDGLTFLRRLRASHAIPVVICSAFSGANSQAAVRALEQGAIDIVRKPELGLREFLDESAPPLRDKARALLLPLTIFGMNALFIFAFSGLVARFLLKEPLYAPIRALPLSPPSRE